eukprot:TRINITY_DN26826_c0_g1_i1.p1 TRINITY_DN26826_c0_g1~~TRINITY_DN26826_c0_g1_i1.p1  ORF type:complete len:345 (+),score=72.14 TRINITY_DN26826_c0_g1_i1:37-1035(+)
MTETLEWRHLPKPHAEALRECGVAGDKERLVNEMEGRLDFESLSGAGLVGGNRYKRLGEAGREEVAAGMEKIGYANIAETVRGKRLDGKALQEAEETEILTLLGLPHDANAANILRKLRTNKAFADLTLYEGTTERSRVDCLLDLFSDLVRFAVSEELTASALSVLWSILWEVHSTSMQHKLPPSNSTSIFHTLLTTHSVHTPPYGQKLIDRKLVPCIKAFFNEVYFSQYSFLLQVYTSVDVVDFEAARPSPVMQPPVPVPLRKSLPLAVREQQDKEKEEAQLKEESERKARPPSPSVALKNQISELRTSVQKAAEGDIEGLEDRIAMLELA